MEWIMRLKDVTIQYYDERGNLRKKKMPQEQFNKLMKKLKKGGMKKVYKVLIKGLWDEVEEAYWELSDEVLKRNVVEKGVAYARRYYKEGKPTYGFLPKRLWERSLGELSDVMDEVADVMRNPDLSRKEQTKEILKLLKK